MPEPVGHLVDSNVLLDIATEDPVWFDWWSSMLADAAALPYAAGSLAGKAFESYRRRGGQRRSPLPDFYIGAHAVVSGLTLLTRDARRYSTYFPTIRLLTP